MKNLIMIVLAGAILAGPALVVAQDVDRRGNEADRRDNEKEERRADRWDRNNRDWWKGRSEFSGYAGPRDGQYFAPGRGYYKVPATYYNRSWKKGERLPAEFRGYRVPDSAFYGLRAPPRGHDWVYVDNDVFLIATATGLIVDSLPDVW